MTAIVAATMIAPATTATATELFILRICACGSPVQAGLTHYRAELSATGQTIVQGIRLFRWQSVRYLAHDLNDLSNDITANAPHSISQQILNRCADFRLGVIGARKIPIILI